MATQQPNRKSRTLPVSNIVEIHGKKALTTSFSIAEGCELEHRAVIQIIRKHQAHFEKFGPCAFEMRVVERKQGGGTPIEYAILNEDQATFAITLFRNNETVINFKVALVKAFRLAVNELERIRQQQQDSTWQHQRFTGKNVRHDLTDDIKAFVAYAKAQGSQNAEQYYQNLTKMEYRALFLIEKAVGDGFRDTLTAIQNANLITAESITQKALREGMESTLHYKAIFQLARQRVEQFAGLIGRSLPGSGQPFPLVASSYPSIRI